ncbi:hypothetical protein DSECCO2_551370 [anaerobic digester metagenome]
MIFIFVAITYSIIIAVSIKRIGSCSRVRINLPDNHVCTQIGKSASAGCSSCNWCVNANFKSVVEIVIVSICINSVQTHSGFSHISDPVIISVCIHRARFCHIFHSIMVGIFGAIGQSIAIRVGVSWI